MTDGECDYDMKIRYEASVVGLLEEMERLRARVRRISSQLNRTTRQLKQAALDSPPKREGRDPASERTDGDQDDRLRAS
jgi:hypothetical protein